MALALCFSGEVARKKERVSIGRGIGRTLERMMNDRVKNVRRWKPSDAVVERRKKMIKMEKQGRGAATGADAAPEAECQEISEASEVEEEELRSWRHAIEMISGLENQLEAGAVVMVLNKLKDLPTGYEDEITYGNRTFQLDASKNLGLKIVRTRVVIVRNYSQSEYAGLRRKDKIVEIQGKPANPAVIRKEIDEMKAKGRGKLNITVRVKESRLVEPEGNWLAWPRTDEILSESAKKIRQKEIKMVGHLRRRLLGVLGDLDPKDVLAAARSLEVIDLSHPCSTCRLHNDTAKEKEEESKGGTWRRAKTLKWGRCSRCVDLYAVLDKEVAKVPVKKPLSGSQSEESDLFGDEDDSDDDESSSLSEKGGDNVAL